MLEWIVNLVGGAFQALLKTRLKTALAALKAKDEKAYKTVLLGLYPVIDVQLEDITDKSKTKADDLLVDGIKEAMEESAADSGITLPNLDSD